MIKRVEKFQYSLIAELVLLLREGGGGGGGGGGGRKRGERGEKTEKEGKGKVGTERRCKGERWEVNSLHRPERRQTLLHAVTMMSSCTLASSDYDVIMLSS